MSTLEAPRPPAARRRRAPTDSSDPVTAYALKVGAGEIVAGPHVREAAARHLRDLEEAAARGWIFDRERVARVIAFFAEVLRLNGGDFEGAPFVLGDWQQFIVGSLFGWVDASGYRRFRVGYVEVGKGNGKSPMAAGIGMYCLVADNEARAEVYSAATKKDQAMILFRDAVAMRNLSPDLKGRLTTSGTGEKVWNLAYPAKGSWFRPLSNDDGQSGPRPHCSLVDEVHEHPDAKMIDMLRLGQKGRRQPLIFEITNSGFDKTTVCYRHHEYTLRVLTSRPGDKDFNDQWFGFVCGLDAEDDPLNDPACWPKANPNLGVSIKREYLEGAVAEARGMPALASKVRRLNFCQWVDADNPWIDGALWMSCEREFDPIEALIECEEVVGALDLSGKWDLTALSLAGKRKDGRLVAHTEFWTPEETLDERAARDRVPYRLWVEQGFLHATPGRAIRYPWVAQRLAELTVRLPLNRVCFDPYRMSFLEADIDEAGIEIELIAHPQGGYRTQPKVDKYGASIPSLWMPHSIEVLGEVIGDGKIDVHRNPVLTWCSANAVLSADKQGNLIFDKRKSRGRIDGVVTLAMAVGLLESSDDSGGLDSLLNGAAIV